MNDLISRQAAVDLLDEYMSRLRIHIGTPNDTKSYSYARGLLVGVINNIKNLPSAQTDVVRCKDCKYYTSVTAQCEIRGKGLYLIRGLYDFCSKAERRTDE